MPYFLGHVPQTSWVYGNLDYSFNKYHRHYQAHDDWYPDRKGKTLGHKNGGNCENIMKSSKYMTLIPNFIPRGCYKEIRKYQMCTQAKGDDQAACLNDKISIMEVCPDHVLDGLKEKKKWYLRAEVIDLRSDSLWQDDRYDPLKYPHPHRYDNKNFPEQEYKDIFGGTKGDADNKERDYHAIGLVSGESKAMRDHAQQARSKNALKDAVHAVNSHNKEQH
jgi:hypothetical protein